MTKPDPLDIAFPLKKKKRIIRVNPEIQGLVKNSGDMRIDAVNYSHEVKEPTTDEQRYWYKRFTFSTLSRSKFGNKEFTYKQMVIFFLNLKRQIPHYLEFLIEKEPKGNLHDQINEIIFQLTNLIQTL